MSMSLGWPLRLNEIRANSVRNTFGYVREYADHRPKPHQGWDFKTKDGDPIYAVGSGIVMFNRSRGDYGLQLCHSFDYQGKTLYAFYAHLLCAYPQHGTPVQRGDLIGLAGSSGNAKGLAGPEKHLHFEIRTAPELGLGLDGRLSPLLVYGRCPLHRPIVG
jgi:murein DD-endopeptidase MepM/ murein hydrolase activator NlpD